MRKENTLLFPRRGSRRLHTRVTPIVEKSAFGKAHNGRNNSVTHGRYADRFYFIGRDLLRKQMKNRIVARLERAIK